MQRAIPILLIFCCLVGCASSGGDGHGAAEGGDAPTSDAAKLVIGEWQIEDDQLGSMRLSVNEDLECVLTDARGKTFEFDADEEGEGFQAEVAVGRRGMKILINQPVTSLEVAGEMNYSMGDVIVTFTPMERDGRQALWFSVQRESRPQDTRESINLLPAAPPGAGSE